MSFWIKDPTILFNKKYISQVWPYSYLTYKKITDLFVEFCSLYRDCIIDYNLIDNIYQKMVDIKIAIM